MVAKPSAYLANFNYLQTLKCFQQIYMCEVVLNVSVN